MLRKLLFISLALLLLSSALGFTKFDRTVLASPYTIDETTRQRILAATVRITLFAPVADEQGNPLITTVDGEQVIQYIAGEGLGTLVRQGSETIIVTHDHWTLLTPNLTKVQFHNTANELLLEVSGEAFRQSIRYRDGGTMILTAADELAARLTAVGMGDGRSANRNDVLLLAYRQPQNGAISVAAMAVKQFSAYQNRPVFQMTSLNGESIVPGNSGGGLFRNGRLVGNMWTMTMEREVSRKTGEVISPQAETSLSLVAQLPVTG